MPRKKRQSKKRVSVFIIAAVIGLIGVVIAAVIQILPDLNLFGPTTTATTVATMGAFVKYDDPSGIFSIEYVPKIAVVSRELSNQTLVLMFADSEPFNPDAPVGKVGAFFVTIEVHETPISDMSQMYDRMVDEFINNNYPFGLNGSLVDDIDTRLISSEKKENGFVIYHQFVSNQDSTHNEIITDTCLLFEYESDISATVFYLVEHDNIESSRELIERTVSSFSWSPAKAKNYFSH